MKKKPNAGAIVGATFGVIGLVIVTLVTILVITGVFGISAATVFVIRGLTTKNEYIASVEDEGQETIEQWLSDNRKGAEIKEVEAIMDYPGRGKNAVFRVVKGTYTYGGEEYELVYNLCDDSVYTSERVKDIEAYIKDKIDCMEMVDAEYELEVSFTSNYSVETEKTYIGYGEERGKTEEATCTNMGFELFPVDISDDELYAIADSILDNDPQNDDIFSARINYTCNNCMNILDKVDFDKYSVFSSITMDVKNGKEDLYCDNRFEDDGTKYVYVMLSGTRYMTCDDFMFGYDDKMVYRYYYDSGEYEYTQRFADEDGFFGAYTDDGQGFEVGCPSTIRSCQIFVNDNKGAKTVSRDEFGTTTTYNLNQVQDGWYQLQSDEEGEETMILCNRNTNNTFTYDD